MNFAMYIACYRLILNELFLMPQKNFLIAQPDLSAGFARIREVADY